MCEVIMNEGNDTCITELLEVPLRQKPNIDEMIIDEVVDNGIAFIPYKVSSMDDIICKYSIKNHKILDESFAEYIKKEYFLIKNEYKRKN